MTVSELIKQLSAGGDIGSAEVVVFDPEFGKYRGVTGITLRDSVEHGRETLPAMLELLLGDDDGK